MLGRIFGRLEVIEEAEIIPPWKRTWLCKCECGNRIKVRGEALRSGNTKSCGCLWEEKRHFASLRHGHARVGRKTPTYRTWRAMLIRCNDPKNIAYPKYGGRGITVCERWHTFDNFLADMGERPSGTTIDRFPDKNGQYEPSNCRWASASQQARNRKHVRMIEYSGRMMCIKDWAADLGIEYCTLRERLRRGWSVAEAFTGFR